MQKLTSEQSKKIEAVMNREYNNVIKATSILTLLKVYYRQGEMAVEMDDVPLEYVTDTILELLSPVQSILGEVGCSAGYLLNEQA